MKRRDFFGQGTAGLMAATATAAISPQATGQQQSAAQAAIAPLPDASLREADPNAYWLRIRQEQFLLPEDRVFLNNGSLGVIPLPVLNTVCNYLAQAAALELDEYPRWGYERLDDERAEMAAFLHCQPGQLAFTHNCTESMGIIASGLGLRAGDEVLTTNEEHPGGRCCWDVQAARNGVRIREVQIPHPPASADDLADRIVSGIGPQTRVLSFSGILTKTGVILPVRAICDAARAKGVLTVVDGAHMNGQVSVNLTELGCDYFAGSPHKWMFAPAGCGLLYGRGDALNRLWPTTVTSGWDNQEGLQAARFQMVGTNNRAIIAGMIAGLRFLQSLGEQAVYQRMHSLAQRTYQMAAQRPYLRLVSPTDDALYGSLVCVDVEAPADKQKALWRRCADARIWLLPGERLRLSCHIHTRPSDLDTFFAMADRVLS